MINTCLQVTGFLATGKKLEPLPRETFKWVQSGGLLGRHLQRLHFIAKGLEAVVVVTGCADSHINLECLYRVSLVCTGSTTLWTVWASLPGVEPMGTPACCTRTTLVCRAPALWGP